MIKVHSTRDLALLEHLKNALMEHGILCYTKNETLTGPAMGEIPPILFSPELWLHREEDLEPARKLIAELLEPRSANAWTCQQCQEELEGQYTDCWNCGTTRSEIVVVSQ